MKPILIDTPTSELKPLDVTCSDTRCSEGYHNFTSAVAPKDGKIGDCKNCGEAIVDWERIYKQDPNDIQYTFKCLKKELLRHVCWSNTLDDMTIAKANKRGRTIILEKAKKILTKKIAKIPTGHFDYLCTPKTGDEIIYYAQHATGSCCRKCAERWHNLPQDILLNETQVNYFVGLIDLYIKERLPALKDEPAN